MGQNRAVEAQPGGYKTIVYVICMVAALGGLLFGFDTAVIAGATGALKTVYGLTPGTLGLTVSAALDSSPVPGTGTAP